MACVEPGAEATAAFDDDDDDDANDAVAVEDSVKDEDLECDGRSFVVDAVVEDVVVGIIKVSPAPFPTDPDDPPPLPSSAKQPVDDDAALEEDAAMPMQLSPPQQQAFLPFDDDEHWPE